MAVQSAGGWTSESATAVHNALTGWCERALASSSSQTKPQCDALYGLIRRLRSTHGDEDLNRARPDTAGHWRGFELLLDERLAKLMEGGQLRTETLLRKHVAAVVRKLAQRGKMRFGDLAAALELGDSSLSNVLALMHRANMIERTPDPADARRSNIRLTAAEQAHQEKAIPGQLQEGKSGAPGTPGTPHGGLRLAGFLNSLELAR